MRQFLSKDVQIFDIRQKFTNQEPVLVPYIENDANQAAVVEFWFLIKNQNCETILIKMVCKLLKFVQKVIAMFCVISVVN